MYYYSLRFGPYCHTKTLIEDKLFIDLDHHGRIVGIGLPNRDDIEQMTFSQGRPPQISFEQAFETEKVAKSIVTPQLRVKVAELKRLMGDDYMKYLVGIFESIPKPGEES
jgi:uncharacterized protein YuzE